MEDFPANSQRAQTKRPATTRPAAKAEEKKVERIATGEVVRRKKPLGKRFKETFFGGDTKGVAGFVLLDVLIPAAKDMVADATSQGIEKALFGEARSSSRRGGSRFSSPNGIVNYSRYGSSSAGRGREERPSLSRRGRAAHDFDEIILATRVEAEEVIDRLFELISKYDQATVADLYELVGVESKYTDNKWGWLDFRGAGVTRVRSGYLLDLPRPEPLD